MGPGAELDALACGGCLDHVRISMRGNGTVFRLSAPRPYSLPCGCLEHRHRTVVGYPAHLSMVIIQPDLHAEEGMEMGGRGSGRGSGTMVNQLVGCPVGHLLP